MWVTPKTTLQEQKRLVGKLRLLGNVRVIQAYPLCAERRSEEPLTREDENLVEPLSTAGRQGTARPRVGAVLGT